MCVLRHIGNATIVAYFVALPDLPADARLSCEDIRILPHAVVVTTLIDDTATLLSFIVDNNGLWLRNDLHMSAKYGFYRGSTNDIWELVVSLEFMTRP